MGQGFTRFGDGAVVVQGTLFSSVDTATYSMSIPTKKKGCSTRMISMVVTAPRVTQFKASSPRTQERAPTLHSIRGSPEKRSGKQQATRASHFG
eukprot:1215190-Amphidinium_carterae.1